MVDFVYDGVVLVMKLLVGMAAVQVGFLVLCLMFIALLGLFE